MSSISNSEKIGLNNEKNVFHYIRSNSPISRADISREIGLSKPAVSSAVKKLLDKELVLEKSAISYDKVGRKPKVLEPNYKAGYFLSSHVGEHSMFFGVSDLSGKTLAKDSMETPREWDSVAETAIKQIKSVFAWADIPFSKILGLSIGVPGVANSETGEVTFSPNLKGPDPFPLGSRLSKKLSPKLYIENGDNLAALGEYYARDADPESLVFLDISEGIGGGIILDGKLQRGFQYHAGEFGWLVHDKEHARSKKESSKGYLEYLASSSSLRKNITGAIYENHGGRADETNRNKIGLDKVPKLYSDHEDVQEIVDDWIKDLSLAISNICAVLDPELIVLGGETSSLVAEFLENIKSTVKANSQRTPKIETSKIQSDVPMIGGIQLCLQNLDELLWNS